MAQTRTTVATQGRSAAARRFGSPWRSWRFQAQRRVADNLGDGPQRNRDRARSLLCSGRSGRRAGLERDLRLVDPGRSWSRWVFLARLVAETSGVGSASVRQAVGGMGKSARPGLSPAAGVVFRARGSFCSLVPRPAPFSRSQCLSVRPPSPDDGYGARTAGGKRSCERARSRSQRKLRPVKPGHHELTEVDLDLAQAVRRVHASPPEVEERPRVGRAQPRLRQRVVPGASASRGRCGSFLLRSAPIRPFWTRESPRRRG